MLKKSQIKNSKVKDIMSKPCRSCHRELATEQKNCPYCGAPQSIFAFYRSQIILVMVVLLGGLYTANSVVDSRLKASLDKVEVEHQNALNAVNEQLTNSQQQLAETNKQLAILKVELTEANHKLAALDEAAGSQNSAMSDALKKAQATAKKQSDRAGWLGRENKRLMEELENVKAQLAVAKKVVKVIPPSTTPQIPEPATVNSQTEENQPKPIQGNGQ